MRDDIRQWVQDECIVESWSKQSAKDLFASLTAWKERKRHPAITVCEWGLLMRKCPDISKVKVHGRMIYKGIRLKPKDQA